MQHPGSPCRLLEATGLQLGEAFLFACPILAHGAEHRPAATAGTGAPLLQVSQTVFVLLNVLRNVLGFQGDLHNQSFRNTGPSRFSSCLFCYGLGAVAAQTLTELHLCETHLVR